MYVAHRLQTPFSACPFASRVCRVSRPPQPVRARTPAHAVNLSSEGPPSPSPPPLTLSAPRFETGAARKEGIACLMRYFDQQRFRKKLCNHDRHAVHLARYLLLEAQHISRHSWGAVGRKAHLLVLPAATMMQKRADKFVTEIMCILCNARSVCVCGLRI